MKLSRGISRDRAFVLLSTMFVVFVLGLVLRVALLRLPAVSGYREHGLAAARAEEAARSGLDYAAAQLREDPSWAGGDAREVIVDEPGVRVVQEQGNVLGSITGPDGSVSEFRLRFNYQDGKDGGDLKPDPGQDLMFDFPYVSLNNLTSDVEVPVPRGTGAGGAVTDPTVGPHNAPDRSVYLVVEGSARGADGQPVSKVLESVYQLLPDRVISDAVLMAGGGLDMRVKQGNGTVFLGGTYITHATDDMLRLRSKQEVRVTRPNGETGRIAVTSGVKAEVGRDDTRGLRAIFDSSKVSEVAESVHDGKDFYNIPWSMAPQAGVGPKNHGAVQIPGGVYVYGETLPLGSGGREVRYYDMTYNQYLNRAESLAADPTKGVVLSTDLREVRSAGNLAKVPKGISVGAATVGFMNPSTKSLVKLDGFRWLLDGVDLKVNPSDDGHTGLAVVPRVPGKSDRNDSIKTPSIADPYNPDFMKLSLRDTTMSVDGEVDLQGGVIASGGTLVATRDVNIVAGRTLTLKTDSKTAEEMEKEFEDMEQGVFDEIDGSDVPTDDGQSSSLSLNIYTKGDLTLSTYVQRLDRYRNMAFQGLLYSWGNVNLIAGRHSSNSRGIIKLKGALVAYGGNPDNESPGGRGDGRVAVSGAHLYLDWDPRFLPSLSTLQPEGSSHFTLRRSLLHALR